MKEAMNAAKHSKKADAWILTSCKLRWRSEGVFCYHWPQAML
jgi:hypothetical protein